jgi:RNA polymerase sigma factor (sigma-70 family)
VADANEATLDQLMARLAQGERAAFDPLFQQLAPRARRVAEARLGKANAADVAQSALLKLFAHAHEFTPGRSLLAWFYAILANEVRSARRAGKAHEAVQDHELMDERASAEQQLIERELLSALEAAVDELDADASEAIHALLGRGPKPQLESATLRKRVSRAYARLRIMLGELR